MPASGRPVQVTGVDIFRMRGGKIVEQWAAYDLLGILMQIGAIPAPAAAAT
jgi:predicted ester cyclase